MKITPKNYILLPALIAALGLSSHTAHAQLPVTAGLVSWWRGEDNALDSEGANNGTLVNGAGFAPGKVGLAFALNGVNQFVQMADSASLEPTNFTLACWFSTSGSVGSLVCKPVGGGSADSYAFWFQGGSLNGKICNNSTEGSKLSFGFTPVAGVWYHAAFTFNNASGAQTLYINGVPVASGNAGIQIGYDASPALIGADNDGGGPVLLFGGEIDEVALYNRVLTTNEIASIYNAGTVSNSAALLPLGMASTGGQSVLFWSQSLTNYALQSSTNLASTNWMTVSDGAVVTAVTVSNTAPARFFRLVQP